MAGDGALNRCPTKRKADEEALVAAPPLPPAKNMMRRERVEYILSLKSQPYHRAGKVDPRADRYDEVAKELAEYQELIRKEVEEKGYVYVPDGYEEGIDRRNREAFKSAYLEVYGCLPPKEDD